MVRADPRKRKPEPADNRALRAGTKDAEIELFRHRFLVSSDLCIRLPIEAATLLRAFVVHSHLSGVIHLQLEAFRPLSRMLWSPDAQRMPCAPLSLPNAGGSSARRDGHL